MAYLSSYPRSHVRIFIKSEQCSLFIIISYELWLQTVTIPLLIKEQQKTNKSEIALFVEDNFYERATTYLVAKEKKNSDAIEKIMTKSEVQTIKRKKWTVNSNNQIVSCDNKVVLSKSQLHENLLFAHNRVAHRGRQKTEHWVKQKFAEVSQRDNY